MHCNLSIIHLIVHIFRGNLLKALREKYFNDAKKYAHSFKGWKPDKINEVGAITWESVDITCLPPILVIGIFCIDNDQTAEGTYTATKINDNFDIPGVRPTLNQWPLILFAKYYLTSK